MYDEKPIIKLFDIFSKFNFWKLLGYICGKNFWGSFKTNWKTLIVAIKKKLVMQFPI